MHMNVHSPRKLLATVATMNPFYSKQSDIGLGNECTLRASSCPHEMFTGPARYANKSIYWLEKYIQDRRVSLYYCVTLYVGNIQCSCLTGVLVDDGMGSTLILGSDRVLSNKDGVSHPELRRSLFVVGDSYVTNIDFYEINWELRSAEITTLFNWIFVFRRFYLSSVSSRRQVFSPLKSALC